MRFVGLDLAWGERARTGAAALDGRGRLVACASMIPDEAIIAFCAAHAPGDAVVAIDAPLVVPNARGQRVAERLVAERFGRYGAAAYPSSRANPLFRPPRALRLARRLGCQVDPAAGAGPGRRLAIEVYPHAATVALFGLDRRLPYKGRQGRPFEVRAAAFMRLLGCVEERLGGRLRPAGCPRWREITAAVAAAARPADLDRVEDEVDAVICAYLAWLWHADPGSCWVLGDAGTGYIVTPRLDGGQGARWADGGKPAGPPGRDDRAIREPGPGS